jgi:hypothetical protein
MASTFLGCEADMGVGVGEEVERKLRASTVSYRGNHPVPMKPVTKMKRAGTGAVQRNRKSWSADRSTMHVAKFKGCVA